MYDARLFEEYLPPWYMFGSLEPREEMAHARKTEVRTRRSGPTTPSRVSERGTASPTVTAGFELLEYRF